MKDKILSNMQYSELIFYLWKNLEKFHKVKLFKLLVIMFLCALFELISLASVFPFLIYITEPNEFKSNQYFYKFINFFGITDNSEILLFITCFFLFAVVLTFFVRLYNIWLNENTSAILGTHISKKVFRNLLFRDYSWHLNSNTSQIINDTINNVSYTVFFISGIFRGLTFLLISIFITLGLIIINKYVAILAFAIFSSCYLLLAYFVRRKLSFNGKILLKNREVQLKNLQEAFGAIRDVILGNNHSFFISTYKKVDRTIRIKQAETEFLKVTPRFLIETVSILFIVLISFVLSSQNLDASGIISLLGTFALGSQRLLPALQGIYNEWANIKVSKPSVISVVEILNSDKTLEDETISRRIPLKEAIVFKSISFKYSKTNKYVFKNLNFSIHKGEKIGIIGETGSGKSTLIDLISGLLEPTSGQIVIDNNKLVFSNYKLIRTWRSMLAHVPQNIYLADSSILENIAFGEEARNIDYEKVKKVSDIALVSEFVESLPAGFDTYVGERGVKLSGGQKQRIGIARALYKNANLIILDEATSALDNKTEKQLINNIYNLNESFTLIMIAHRLTTLKRCDRIFELKNNKLSETKISNYGI